MRYLQHRYLIIIKKYQFSIKQGDQIFSNSFLFLGLKYKNMIEKQRNVIIMSNAYYNIKIIIKKTWGLKLDWQVERKIDLVYGGGSIGLMGLVSKAVFNGGRHVLGYKITISIIALQFELLSLWTKIVVPFFAE